MKKIGLGISILLFSIVCFLAGLGGFSVVIGAVGLFFSILGFVEKSE